MQYFFDYENTFYRNLGKSDAETQAKLLDAINIVQEFLSEQTTWTKLTTTESFTIDSSYYTYDIDTDFYLYDLRHINSMFINDGTRNWPTMPFITYQKWDEAIGPYIHNLSGRPTGYTIYNRVIMLDKYPDTDYTLNIRYTFKPLWISSSLDEVSLAGECDGALIALTTSITWLALEETENAKFWFDIAKGLLKSSKIDMNKLVNFSTYTKAKERSNVGPDYWSDPFRKRAP